MHPTVIEGHTNTPHLLLDLRDLLPLLAGWSDLGAEDDVTDLTLREGVGVDVVLLGIVGQDEVLERNLNLLLLLVSTCLVSLLVCWLPC
jgi:hypothetical protein